MRHDKKLSFKTLTVKLNNNEIIYILYSLIVLLITCTRLIDNYKLNEYILIITFAYICFLTLRYKSFSIYQIFLFSYMFFLVGRILLDAFGVYDMRTLNLYQKSMMSDDLANSTIKVLLVFLIGTSYAWLVYNKKKIHMPEESFVRKPYFNKILEVIYYMYIVLFVLKMFFFFKAVVQYGYISLFNGVVVDYTPKFLTGVVKICESLFIVLIFYNRDRKHFVKYALLLAFAGFTKLFTGQRAYGFVLLLFILFMYSTYYREIKIFNWKIILIAVITPFIIEAVANLRWSGIILSENMYFKAFSSQGVSLEVVADTINLNDHFANKVPFIFGYFVDVLKNEPSGQVIEDITQGNYLGDHLTYNINSDLFFHGRGTGTSIVAESFELAKGNLFVVFLVGFLITLIAYYLVVNMYKSVYLMATAYYYLTDFIFCPRDSVFKSIKDLLFALFISFLINIMINICDNRLVKNKKTANWR